MRLLINFKNLNCWVREFIDYLIFYCKDKLDNWAFFGLLIYLTIIFIYVVKIDKNIVFSLMIFLIIIEFILCYFFYKDLKRLEKLEKAKNILKYDDEYFSYIENMDECDHHEKIKDNNDLLEILLEYQYIIKINPLYTDVVSFDYIYLTNTEYLEDVFSMVKEKLPKYVFIAEKSSIFTNNIWKYSILVDSNSSMFIYDTLMLFTKGENNIYKKKNELYIDKQPNNFDEVQYFIKNIDSIRTNNNDLIDLCNELKNKKS